MEDHQVFVTEDSHKSSSEPTIRTRTKTSKSSDPPKFFKTLPQSRRLDKVKGSKKDSSQFLLNIPLDLPPSEEPPNEISETFNNILTISPRRIKEENSTIPHKFSPHLWKPKYCRVCYCTPEEHDDGNIEDSSDDTSSRHPLSGRTNSHGRPSLMNSGSQYLSNVLRDSQQNDARSALNNWIKQNKTLSNSLFTANTQLNFVENFTLSSMNKDYKDEIILVARITLKKNYKDMEETSLAEKKVQFGLSKCDEIESLNEKERILLRKEAELNAREEKLIQQELRYNSIFKNNGLQDELAVAEIEENNIQVTKKAVSRDKLPFKSSNKSQRLSEEKPIDQHKTSPNDQTIIPLIKKIKGFKIWEPREDLEVKRDSLLTFEFPEHDIFYYRDNFLINPAIYQVLENCVQHYSSEMGHFLEAVDATFFWDHINLISDEPIVFIASIRKLPDIHGNIPGIVRTKLGDRPFILDGDWKKKGYASTSELVSAFRKHFTCFGRCKLLAIETMYLDEKNEEIKNRSRSNSLTSYIGSGKSSIKYQKSSADKLTKFPEKKKYLPVELLELDRKLKVQTYKIGVLYVKNSEESLQTILNKDQEDVNPNFFKFMDFIGTRIKLKSWKGYKADLDTKNNASGTDSYYCDYETTSIMYHCCPLLTFDERERLLGNDLIHIIYLEEGQWDASIFESQVTHGYIVIRPVVGLDDVLRVRVALSARKGVPETLPYFSQQVFDLDENFRKVLLSKFINMERASWKCPTTIRKQQRALRDHYWAAREGHLKYLVTEHLNSEHGKEYT